MSEQVVYFSYSSNDDETTVASIFSQFYLATLHVANE